MHNYPEGERPEVPVVLEIERALIGSSIIVKGMVDSVLEMTSEDDYYFQANREIYKLLALMVTNGESIDPTTIVAKAEEVGKVGLIEQIVSALENIITIENAEENYIPKLIEKATERRMIDFGKSVPGIISSEDSHEKRIDEVDKKYYEARYRTGMSKITSAIDLVRQTLDDMYARHSGKLVGYKTGLVALDKIIGEFQQEDLVVIAGRPSSGKTSLAVSIMLTFLFSGIKVGFLSVEMSKKQICYRMASMLSGVSLFKIIHGMTSKSEFPALQSALSKISELPLQIEDSPNITAVRAKSIMRHMVSRGGAQVIFIDHLHEMQYEGTDQNTGLEKICAVMKGAAKEFQIPVILLAQLSRGDSKVKDKRPTLTALRGSGSIEQKADVVIFVHREELYDKKDEELKGKAELIVAKQRNGPTETAEVRFKHITTQFHEEDRQEF